MWIWTILTLASIGASIAALVAVAIENFRRHAAAKTSGIIVLNYSREG